MNTDMPTRSKLSAGLYLLVVFLSGALVGGLSYRLYSVNTVAAITGGVPKTSPEEFRKRYIEAIRAKVNLDPQQIELGRKLNPNLAPHWYSLPRWVYVPLPKDAKLANQIVSESIGGGDDVIDLPRYYRPWEEGLADLHAHLQTLDKLGELDKADRQVAAAQMQQIGFAPDRPVVAPMIGKGRPLVAVVDPASTKIVKLIQVD